MISPDEPANPETLEDVKAELISLIGLEPVKEDFLSISNLLRVRQLRKEHELSTEALSLHLVFTGNRAPAKRPSPAFSRAHTGRSGFSQKVTWSKSTDRDWSPATSDTVR
jgi:hypothetical protein